MKSLLVVAFAIGSLVVACVGDTPTTGAKGKEGGPCNDNGTCNGSLICASNVCVHIDGGSPVDGSTGPDALTDGPSSDSSPGVDASDASPPGYTGNFTSGAQATAQCTAWDMYRSSLTGFYTKVTISGSNDSIGHTCTGPNANTICQDLRNGIGFTVICDGFQWQVYVSSSPPFVELAVDTVAGGCNSPPATTYSLRPCINNQNWGGVKTTNCNPPTQTIAVVCQ